MLSKSVQKLWPYQIKLSPINLFVNLLETKRCELFVASAHKTFDLYQFYDYRAFYSVFLSLLVVRCTCYKSNKVLALDLFAMKIRVVCSVRVTTTALFHSQ